MRIGYVRICEIWVVVVGVCSWLDVVDSFCVYNFDYDFCYFNVRVIFVKR